jgi:hypothetical protein
MQFDNTNADDDFHFAQRIDGNFSGADNTTADREQGGIYLDIDSSADGDASNEHRLYGIYNDVRFTGFSDIAQGIYTRLESNNSTEKTTAMYAVYAHAVHDSGVNGGVSQMIANYGVASVEDAGDVDNAYAGFFLTSVNASRTENTGNLIGSRSEVTIDAPVALSLGDAYGVQSVIDNNEGTLPSGTNTYLFRGEYQGTRYATNAYGLYVQGDKHYLEGKLGIGVGSPDYTFHAYHATTNVVGQFESGDNQAWVSVKDSGYGTYGAMLGCDSANSQAIILADNSATKRLVIDNNGLVGIGEDNPQSLLHLVGNSAAIRIEESGGAQVRMAAGGSTGYIGTYSNHELQFLINGNNAITVNTSRNVGIGTTSPQGKLDVNGQIILSGDIEHYIEKDTTSLITGNVVETTTVSGRNVDLYAYDDINLRAGTGDNITMHAGGSERIRLNSSGNVGIGTTSPSGKLHADSGLAHNNIYFTTDSSGGTGYDVTINMNGGANNSEMKINMGIVSDPDREQIRAYQGQLWLKANNSDRVQIDANSMLFNTTSKTGIDTDENHNGHFLINGMGYILDTNTTGTTGRLGYTISPSPHQPSIKTGTDAGVSSIGGGDGSFPNTVADSAGFASATNYTFADALAGLQGDGARLPRLEEVCANYGSGTGDGTDSQWIWTQTFGAKGYVYQVKANFNSYPDFRLVDPTNTANVARVRRFFDISKANLPVYYDNNARINVKEIRAEHSDGLKLADDGGNVAIFIEDGGEVAINKTTASYALDVDGTIRAEGDVIAYSDARVKENVHTIDNALDKVTQLRGVSYNKIGETEEKIGVIAQEIEKVLPQVVQEDAEGMKSVAYGNIVGVLIEAIKEQQKQIDELKARLDGSTK